MTQYERYKQLSLAFEYTFRGIKLNHVLALDLWTLAKKGNICSWKSLFKPFLAYNVDDIKMPLDCHFMATDYSTSGRKDHKNLFNSVISKLCDKPYVNHCLSNRLLRIHISIHPVTFVKVLFLMHINTNQLDVSFYNKVKIICEYIFLCNFILDLDKN